MRKSIILVLAVVLIAVILSGGYFGWNYLANNSNQNNAAPSLTMEQVRDRTMVYIGANHTETVQLMQNLAWSGGRQETGLVGSEIYLYGSGNWALQIQYPVVENPTYVITANFSSQNATVEWAGTCQNGALTETSQTINVSSDALSTQEHARDITIAYIKAFHNQTAQYMQSLSWTGGRTTPEGILGAETYTYQSSDWTLTIHYPVVPNAIYSVNATYQSAASISWQGTLQSGVIAESAFNFNP